MSIVNKRKPVQMSLHIKYFQPKLLNFEGGPEN